MIEKKSAQIFILSLMIASFSFGQNRIVEKINDNWQFKYFASELDYVNITDTSWQDISLPHTWNNKDIQSGDKVNYGTAWYRRKLTTNPSDIGKEYFLRFEGVGQYAEIYINNKFVGEHLGSYSAFVFNITKFLNPGNSNQLLVKVNNELNNSYPKDNFLFGIYGGIYRDVYFIQTDNIHIALTDFGSSGVYVTQENISEENALIKIETLLKNESNEIKNIKLTQKFLNKESKTVNEKIVEYDLYPKAVTPALADLNIDNPRLWNGKKDPYLYSLVTELSVDGKIVDQITQPIGLRYYEIDPQNGFILNGKPYRLYGVCRHQEWEDLGNALLPIHHKTDMELIDELGATSIRLAHYQQAEYIYSLADTMGFLIWAEIPFVNGYNPNADANAKQQLIELIKQNYNHPSIFVWGLHNEVIKGNTIQEPVNLTKELHNIAKTLDKKRYTVSVSNIWWVFDHLAHENTDLQGFNQYSGWYGGRPDGLGKWIKNYHDKKPEVRFSISEYGAGGNIAHQTSDLSFTPDPKGQFFPETYNTYYHEITYAAIEKSPFIWASYVWNMFDFSVPLWNRGGIKGRNHKGLITYDRKTKKDAFFWYKANWSNEKMLYLPGRRNDSLNTAIYDVKAYCNFNSPELYVNDTKVGKMDEGINSVHFTKEGIKLNKGKNKIEVRAQEGKNKYSDHFYLNVDLN